MRREDDKITITNTIGNICMSSYLLIFSLGNVFGLKECPSLLHVTAFSLCTTSDWKSFQNTGSGESYVSGKQENYTICGIVVGACTV